MEVGWKRKMKVCLKLKFVFLICILFLALIQSISAQNSGQEKLINSFITEQAVKNNAEEYKDARRIIRADLNRDGKKDVIILYTLESFGGNNNYLQYLAIFIEKRNGKFQYAANKIIGGKNQRVVELASVRNGRINFDTLDYLPADASCCPSKKGKIQIILVKNNLKEIKLTK